MGRNPCREGPVAVHGDGRGQAAGAERGAVEHRPGEVLPAARVAELRGRGTVGRYHRHDERTHRFSGTALDDQQLLRGRHGVCGRFPAAEVAVDGSVPVSGDHGNLDGSDLVVGRGGGFVPKGGEVAGGEKSWT